MTAAGDPWDVGTFVAPVAADVEAEIVQAARRAYPREMCGVVIAGQFHECDNVADNPMTAFKIPADDFSRALRSGLDAIVHSHPDGFPAPSEDDMRQQVATAVPWGIVGLDRHRASPIEWFGDQLPGRAPLIGRGFCHGVRDCFSLLRDYYHVIQGRYVMDGARGWEWWEKGQSLYMDNFAEAGFERIAPRQVRAGDAFVCMVGRHASAPNHAGIFLGGGLILHHLTARDAYDPTRLSRREPIGRYANREPQWFRLK